MKTQLILPLSSPASCARRHRDGGTFSIVTNQSNSVTVAGAVATIVTVAANIVTIQENIAVTIGTNKTMEISREILVRTTQN